MKKASLISAMMAVILLSSSSALAADWVYGYVDDSSDGLANSYGRTVTLYKQGSPSDFLTNQIGVGYTGGDGGDPTEMYMIDCSLLQAPCHNGDVMVIVVNDDGSGYKAGPVQKTIVIPGTNKVADMQLAKDQPPVCADSDLDGYNSSSCGGTDCNDTNNAIHPGATEVCDGIDNDCDGSIDEGVKTTFYLDSDSDNYGSSTTTQACIKPAGYATVSGDCNDTNAAINPGATEVCDGVDNDCDSSIDEGFSLGSACSAGIGECYRTGTFVCSADHLSTTCSAVAGSPTAEICDGLDNDCDGTADNNMPPGQNSLTVSSDSPSYYQGQTVTLTAQYFDDSCNPITTISSIGFEVYDANNASASVGQPSTNSSGVALHVFALGNGSAPGTWSAMAAISGASGNTTFLVLSCDADGDTHLAIACGGDDFNDTDPTSYPGAPELCDGKDNDGDLGTDEGFNLGNACTSGIGACARAGILVCSADHLTSVCNATAGSPSSEVCGNGIDEDCDGSDTACFTSSGGGGGGGYVSSYCGNGICTSTESCSSCPQDCGQCAQNQTEGGEGTQCVPDWKCSDWSACSPAGKQTRGCIDANECVGSFTSEPDSERDCVYTEAAPGNETGAPITGQFFLFEPAAWPYWIAIVLGIAALAAYILVKRKKTPVVKTVKTPVTPVKK